jgi:hypothetical protein
LDSALLIFVIILPVLAIMGWASITYSELKIARDAWSKFATRMRLNYVSTPGMEGTYRNCHILIRTDHIARFGRRAWTGPGMAGDQTHFELGVSNPLKIRLVISNDDDVSRLRQLTGLNRLKVFRDTVALPFTTHGEPEEFLQSILNSPALNSRIEAINAPFTMWLTDNQLCMDHAGYVVNEEYLLSLLDLLSNIARRVDTTRQTEEAA